MVKFSVEPQVTSILVIFIDFRESKVYTYKQQVMILLLNSASSN